VCGLTGVWQRGGDDPGALSERVAAMTGRLVHRGPDDSGTWVDAAAGVGLGFRRLSILDLSSAGHQPMHSPDGRFAIVHNGETYNFRDLRAELEARGHRFRGHSDTEVILAACCEWGPEAAIPRLWGMFALAVWDRRERRLILARDRLGKKPLYYAVQGSLVLFGSELKALRAHPAFSPEVDPGALALYMRLGYVPAPWCIYRGARKLRQGCLAVVPEDGPLAERLYWDALEVAEAGLHAPDTRPEADAVEELDALLRDAVGRRMVSDVPLGAFLSGGIDSSTIVALMQAQSARPVQTFSIGFHEDAYNEAEPAGKVARHLGTDHTELYVTPEEALAVIPRLADLYDEPFADVSQIPTYLVSELARRRVTVSLTGDGGDEVFGGYGRYTWASAAWDRLRWVRPLRAALRGAIRLGSPGFWDAAVRRLGPLLPSRLHGRVSGDRLWRVAQWLEASSDDDLYVALVSRWARPDGLVAGGDEPHTILRDTRVRQRIPGYAERMMLLDLVTYLPDDILVKVDRASMAVSLEARCPLLDHRVVEFAWRLPLSMRIRGGKGKWLLRRVLDRYVPSHLVDRPKMGFDVPIGAWLRGPLREWAQGLLSERRLRDDGFLDPQPVLASWAAHLAGRGAEQQRLWTVLMFQAWGDRWLRRSDA
jgi:asparagine synthase (glutamine-hydrolysing)